jgi:tripartite-type tricarboxylate transporter receptor subunit TctC
VADFEPIGLSAGTPILLLARKGFPAKDLKAFVAHVKAKGDKLTMAHAGVGSVSFTTCLLLNSILGLNPTPVTYNGTGPAMHALLADQVDYMCDQINSVVSQVAGGTIKAYLVASASRNPILPGVPTSREAGLPAFEVTAWNGLFAPKGTPKPILDKLTDALDKALSDETTRERLLKLGCDVPDEPRQGQEALRTLVKNEIERWRPVITAARAKSAPF